MNPIYPLRNSDTIHSPALLFYPEIIQQNIANVVEIAGSAAKLRPHVKTHKTREIVQMQLAVGITKHKCATIAEAEMLAMVGVPDVLLAYPLVGPNLARLATLIKKYPQTSFAVLVDHPAGIAALNTTMQEQQLTVRTILDLNVGQERTGITPGTTAQGLYKSIGQSPGLHADGFQVYDGHNHQESLAERQAAVTALLAPVLDMRAELEHHGYRVPRLICGGTPTFSIFAKLDIPGLECSPGTFVLYDQGYGARYPDLAGFTPAAVLLTRVISRPSPQRVTLDLGYKAVASDPPAGKRCTLLNVENYTIVLQSEEHLVFETPQANDFRLGAVIYALPTHVCPTCALHQRAWLVEKGEIVGSWEIVGRDRMLTI